MNNKQKLERACETLKGLVREFDMLPDTQWLREKPDGNFSRGRCVTEATFRLSRALDWLEDALADTIEENEDD
jgi:hypothetical protein